MLFANAPTDFWGIVIPGWIGAVGGLVGGVVAVVSLIIAVRSRDAADAARAAEAQTRAVVADTITELQRANDQELTDWLEANETRAGVLAPKSEVDATRTRYAERTARYDALLQRLRPHEPPSGDKPRQ